MKKDKEWLMKETKTLLSKARLRVPFVVSFYNLIDQLDEPVKVVIPQFVADYLETAKKEISLLRVFEIANGLNELDMWRKEYNWIRLYHLDFARAWLDGYEIEKELLYVVEDNRYCLLCKFDGMVISTHLSESDEIPLEHLDFELTEKEIKDYDERYWQFAAEVAE